MIKIESILGLLLIFYIPFISTQIRAAHLEGQSIQGRTINFQVADMGHLPWEPEASYSSQLNFNSAVFTDLLYFDSQLNILPGLFKDWKWNEKRQTYTFTTDSNYFFSEKRPVQLKDIEFALVKSAIVNTSRSELQILGEIEGLDKLEKGKPFVSGSVSGIRLIEPNKIEIQLKKANSRFLYKMASSTPPVGPVEEFKSNLFSFKGLPVGSGNYKVSKVIKESSMVKLVRKKNKFDESQKFPLIINFFLKGHAGDNEIDLATKSAATQLKDRGYLTEMSRIPTDVIILDFNYSNKWGVMRAFREGVALAVDRNDLWDGYEDIKPSFELIPRFLIGQAGESPQFNPQKAKLNFKKLFNGKAKVSAWYHGVVNEELPGYVKKIKNQLEKVGLDVHFIGTDKHYFGEDSRNISFYIYSIQHSYGDPLVPMGRYIDNDQRAFHTDVNDAKSKKLFRKVKNIRSKDKQAQFLTELSKHFIKEYRQIPLGERYPIFRYKNEKIKDIGIGKIFNRIDFDRVQMK